MLGYNSYGVHSSYAVYNYCVNTIFLSKTALFISGGIQPILKLMNNINGCEKDFDQRYLFKFFVNLEDEFAVFLYIYFTFIYLLGGKTNASRFGQQVTCGFLPFRINTWFFKCCRFMLYFMCVFLYK